MDGRYLIALDGSRIVAITGISDTETYKGLEVDWTCVLPEYRGNNLITHMLSILLKHIEKDVYCSCWRLQNKPINLHKSMDDLGFHLYVKIALPTPESSAMLVLSVCIIK